MRRVLILIAILVLGLPGTVWAQGRGNGYVQSDAPELDDLNIVKVFFRGGCFSYESADNGNYLDSEEEDFIWTGQCAAGQPINGPGIFRRVTVDGSLSGDWTERTGTWVDGITSGKVTWKSYVTMNSPGERDFNGSNIYTRGCIDNEEYCAKDFATLAKRRKSTSSLQASVTPNAADHAESEEGGMQGAYSATGGDVGQNRGKGGNPDWIYDDDDHGQCISIQTEGAPVNTGREIAYGHYQLINNCGYPLKVLLCITPDRADGSPSHFDEHQDGSKCPGGGWGMTSINAREEKNDQRTWYEFDNLKWSAMACREGWDFVAVNGQPLVANPPIGTTYSCRMRRP